MDSSEIIEYSLKGEEKDDNGIQILKNESKALESSIVKDETQSLEMKKPVIQLAEKKKRPKVINEGGRIEEEPSLTDVATSYATWFGNSLTKLSEQLQEESLGLVEEISNDVKHIFQQEEATISQETSKNDYEEHESSVNNNDTTTDGLPNDQMGEKVEEQDMKTSPSESSATQSNNLLDIVEDQLFAIENTVQNFHSLLSDVVTSTTQAVQLKKEESYSSTIDQGSENSQGNATTTTRPQNDTTANSLSKPSSDTDDVTSSGGGGNNGQNDTPFSYSTSWMQTLSSIGENIKRESNDLIEELQRDIQTFVSDNIATTEEMAHDHPEDKFVEKAMDERDEEQCINREEGNYSEEEEEEEEIGNNYFSVYETEDQSRRQTTNIEFDDVDDKVLEGKGQQQDRASENQADVTYDDVTCHKKDLTDNEDTQSEGSWHVVPESNDIPKKNSFEEEQGDTANEKHQVEGAAHLSSHEEENWDVEEDEGWGDWE